MRILVLGAGALGGYFGGRALEKGADVSFLVRPRRAEQLARDGLVVRGPLGDFTRPVTALTQAGPGFDVVLLTAKAYDLDDAIGAIRPAMQAGAAVLPVLNGMAHLDALNAAFGRDRVWGGLAHISASLGADGTIRQVGDWCGLYFGEQDGRMDGQAAALAAALGSGNGLQATVVPDILGRMWEKMVTIGTLAAATVLFRAAVGDILRAGGEPFLDRLLEGNAAIAAANGHPLREAYRPEMRKLFGDRDSPITASLMKDVEAGGRNEADHILGWLAEAGERAGVDTTLQRAAWVHAKAQAERRAREARAVH
jgi:2-dehydropantoate 2-reductase